MKSSSSCITLSRASGISSALFTEVSGSVEGQLPRNTPRAQDVCIRGKISVLGQHWGAGSAPPPRCCGSTSKRLYKARHWRAHCSEGERSDRKHIGDRRQVNTADQLVLGGIYLSSVEFSWLYPDNLGLILLACRLFHPGKRRVFG